MKTKRQIAAIGSTLLACLLLGAPAQAGLILTLTDGTDTATVTDVDADGGVLFVGSIGDWILNITIGVADALSGGDGHSSRLDLASLNVTGRSENGGTLTISITDTDNTVPIGDTPFYIGVGGNSGGTVSFASYVDSSNTPFGTQTLIHDTGILGGGAFSAEAGGTTTVDGPYSITTVATITHNSGFDITGFTHGVEIPEPAGLALFGIGLLGLAFGIRKSVKRR